MLFHKTLFIIASVTCGALFLLYLPLPLPSAYNTGQYRNGCFTCRCTDSAGRALILGPVCNYRSSLAQTQQDFSCEPQLVTTQCQELSAQQGLELVSIHVWQG